jgi:hypothetical protein
MHYSSVRTSRRWRTRAVWNTPDQLGAYLQVKMGFNADDSRLIVRDAFILYAAQLVSILAESAGQPPAGVGARLREAGMLMREMLLGLPTAD